MFRRFSMTDLGAAKRFFNSNGFVIFEDAFPSEVLSDFKNEVSHTILAFLEKSEAGRVQARMQDPDVFHTGMEVLESVDHEQVAEVYDSICQCPSFFRLIGEKNIVSAVQALMDDPNAPLYGFTNRCRIDPPADERRTYGWHQEVFYTIPRSSYIQSWAPLIEDTTVENGTIKVAKGSHKEGIADQTWNEQNGRATQIIVSDDILEKYDQVSLEMKVGELLLFSGSLVHKSGTNVSRRHRYSLVGMYHNVRASGFQTPKISYEYRGQSPKQYFDTVFGK